MSLSIDLPPRWRMHWADWELEALVELLHAGESLAFVAQRLGRGEQAVHQMAEQVRSGKVKLPAHVAKQLPPLPGQPTSAAKPVVVDIRSDALADDLKRRLSSAVRNSRRTGGAYTVTLVAKDGRRVMVTIHIKPRGGLA